MGVQTKTPLYQDTLRCMMMLRSLAVLCCLAVTAYAQYAQPIYGWKGDPCVNNEEKEVLFKGTVRSVMLPASCDKKKWAGMCVHPGYFIHMWKYCPYTCGMCKENTGNEERLAYW